MIIGILGSPKTVESKWLEEEAQKRSHEVIRFTTSDFSFITKDNRFSIESEFDFSKFDVFLVRGLFRSYEVKGIQFNKSTESFLFLRYVHDILKKPIVDERLVKNTTIISKMATSLNLSKEKLPQPNTFQYPNKETILSNLDNLTYPIIVKNPAGRQGRNIFKVDNEEELNKLLNDFPREIPFLFQQYLPTDGDIRVLVVGYKIIGAMKRFVIPGDFRANISQGAKAEKYNLPKEAKEIAIKAAEITKTEFAGVDLIESKGKYYVIEVNRAPQFRGFKKYTGIDPSPFIIDYLENKVNRK